MAARPPLGRREFLQIAAGSVGFLAAATPGQPAVSGEAQASRPPRRHDPAQLRKLLGEMEARGPQFWSVPRRDGELLHFLVKATRAKHVLEVGTSHGYSAIWMGLGLEENDGRLVTIELDAARHDLARRHVSEAGLSQRVTLLKGDAHVEVTKLDGPFDFVFLDADKEGQMDYFNKLYPKRLSPGGVLAVHNAIQQAGVMKDYLDMLRKHPDFDSVIVSATMIDGFCLSYRRRSA